MIGFIDELDSAASVCASICAFQPDNVDTFFKEASKFEQFVNKNNSVSLENNFMNVISKIGKNVKKVNIDSFINKKQISKYITFISEKIDKSYSKIEKLKEKSSLNKISIEELKHFRRLEYKIGNIKNCKYISSKFIKIKKNDFFKLDLSDEKNYDKLVLEKISEDDLYFYCIVFFSKEFAIQFDKIFGNTQFYEMDFSRFKETPSQEIENLTQENSDIESKMSKLNDGIQKFWQHQEEYCCKVYSCLKEYEKYENIKSYAKIYKNNFALVGWIPESKVDEISSKLDKISRIDYSIESGNELLKYSPPTKLKNKKIFSPFEFFVSTFGLPKYSDIDPTPFVAITYTLIFGMMFADVGQGLLIALAGLFLNKVKKMKFGNILTACGLSSSLFGFVFGSFFGFENALDPIYKFLNLNPVRAMESTMPIIIASICIGIICLLLAMSVNIYSLIRKKDILEAILSHSGICGIALYSSLVTLILSSFLNFSRTLSLLSILIMVTSLVLVFFKGIIKSKFENTKIDVGEYLFSQVFEIFEILLSYFTNTLSFIRVGVFIFVHTGMMMVVFNLAEMFSIAYYPIIIIGNIFVTCLEALLVGMQVMRLQFCELFGRFFEGGGREFTPIVSDKGEI